MDERPHCPGKGVGRRHRFRHTVNSLGSPFPLAHSLQCQRARAADPFNRGALLLTNNEREKVMKKEEVVEAIVLGKKARGLTWEAIAGELGHGTVWVTSACLGMNSMPESVADKVCQLFDLPAAAKAALMEFPCKTWEKAVPQDPLIYRLYEIVGVYGDTLKEVIQEKFGDGIMSAIDFSMDVEKEENPKGDRVIVTMNGKFLPYKTW